MKQLLLPIAIVVGVSIFFSALANNRLNDPYAVEHVLRNPFPSEVTTDTLPPIEDRNGDFINDKKNNPFDFKDPSVVEQEVEYDPITNRYIIREKIGDDYFRPPTYMTFQEYMEWRRKQDERQYFRQLAGIGVEGGRAAGVDPLADIDVDKSLLDRLFGGSTVDIRPQGSIDLTFGVDASRVENPILTERQRRQGGFDFDMNIQMNVTGKIGEKLNLTTNYNTNATFDFDNQIKLDYNSDLFDDDAILKKIEAGNVSLPLRGNLIQGAQSLFGLKTELQFGHLRLTGIVSQQRSQQENLQIEGGAQLTEFEVKADEYDENRHFFLTHYNRETFEGNLQNLPQIRSLFKIENLEVWITNDRNEVDNVRDIVAFADLGEGNPATLVSPDKIGVPAGPVNPDITGGPLPDNTTNDLYQRILDNPNVREIDQAVSILQGPTFQLQQARDFEKVSARKLREQEYTFHPELGFVSLNVNVQPDQVVGVAFTYSYNGQTYKVGELSYNQENASADSSLNVLFVKMLKSTTQRIDVSTWDLMMKNIYSIGAFNVNRQDFELDIFYEDPGQGIKRFLPEGELMGQPLLRIFNLDKLNVQGDPVPDGVFDYVPGVTINPRNGRVMFPVLEPFGSALSRRIPEPELQELYVFQELYDQTVFQAREFPEKNRFTIKGSFKSNVTSEYSLGAFNIPRGSVTVRAGGQVLVEGQDYDIDYNTGRLKIINDAILNSGAPVNVSFEDNTLFGLQTKTMLGLRADYEVDKDFSIGATFLQLFERPFTQKVNIGEDPINNKIYGLDFTLNREAPWLTKAVNFLPFYNTKEPSSISVTGEAAFLKPGHSRAINQNRQDKGGVVFVDDFEGSVNGIDITQPANRWFLASVPQNDEDNNNPRFPESALVNDVRYGSNRARINWYRIDPSVRNQEDNNNPYTNRVEQQEVFPNSNIPPSQQQTFRTFDISFYPQERGPYNFDIPGGYPGLSQGVSFLGDSLILNDPASRWGGIMRDLTNNDFQTANIEFLEFWMLSPFHDPANPLDAAPDFEELEGDMYINLGNVSEDILRDSRKFFENGLPSPFNPERRVDTTTWSAIPVSQQITQTFDNDVNSREVQDVGYDGLDNDGERVQFNNYLNILEGTNPLGAAKIAEDPAGDDYRYYRDNVFGANASVLDRYRFFNNPHGNSRANDGSGQVSSATNLADAEDLNQDNTLNETESYFEYRIPLRANLSNPREIDQQLTPFITDQRVDGSTNRVWYRFRIPLRTESGFRRSVGGIRDFRSIRFMRVYLKGFERPVTLRFARMELVRSQWRTFTQPLSEDPPTGDCNLTQVEVGVDAVNIEENSDRQPFRYVLPEGIQREQSLGVFNALQNEQSISIRTQNLCDGLDRAIFKNVDMDWRVYDRFKMFVHAEPLNESLVEDGDLALFVRMGSDFRNNYYEYEIPLVMSDSTNLPVNFNSVEYKRAVWRAENEFDFALSLLTELKKRRNANGISLGEEYEELLDVMAGDLSHRIRIKGNPNLGLVKTVMVGIRNPSGGNNGTLDSEVWINEMRLTGLDERGGMAAVGRIDMQLADLGSLTIAGNYSSIGFGAIDQKVQQRNREEISGIDLAANLELGKFFPTNWGIRFPFFAQYSRNVKTPEFDPLDLDLTLKEKLDEAGSTEERDFIRSTAQEVTTIQSINFTNVRKERTGGGGSSQKKPAPWDVENFTFNYAYSKTEVQDPIIEFDREEKRSFGMGYGFNRTVNYVEPLKFLGDSKALEIFTSFNFNPIPNSFTFNTVLDRRISTTRYRFTGLDERFNTFFNKNYTWGRDYSLQWDLAKSLKFTYNAVNDAVIDEPDEARIREDPDILDPVQYRKDSIWQNIQRFGRTKNFRHNFTLSYNVPTKFIPFLSWVQVKAQYQASYNWAAAALNVDSLGNVIGNSQNRQINTDFNFEALYNSIPYLKKINGSSNSGRRPNLGGRRTPPAQQNNDQDKDKKRDGPSTIEKILIRPLLSLRRARFNYSENFATTVPGYLPQSRLLGMQPGFGAPGWDFIAGLQPNIRGLDESQYGTSEDWLFQSAQKGWISSSVFLNQEVVQDYTQRWDGRATVEPFPDFRVDIEISREYTENHTEFFKDIDPLDGQRIWEHTVPKQFGSMTISFSALSTLFDDDRDQLIELFNTFEENRVIISRRLGDPNTPHDDENLAAQGFTKNYGRTQQDVLIPAFLSAYTGQDPNTVNLNIFDTSPRLNWRLTYNGLTKLPLFKEVFQNFSISHSYRSTLTVNSFNTGLDFLRTEDDPNGPVNELNQNFYPRLEIPQVDIQEGFSPLIQVDATLQNGMSFNMNYNKTRRLGMSFISNQLSETQTSEISVGFGYLIKNFGLFSPDNGRGRNNQNDQNQPNQRNNRLGGARPNQGQAQDLDIKFNLSLRDDVTFNHLLDQDIIEPTRGTYSLSISPSAEYRINSQLSLRLFFDYRRNVPKTSAGFPRTDTSGGVILRFSLQ